MINFLNIGENKIIFFHERMQDFLEKHFPVAQIRGCLFHLKQALYRRAHEENLLKSDNEKESITLIVIKKENEKIENEEFKKIKEKYQKESTKFNNYLDYFEKNWFKLISNKQIDYSNENEILYRSNSYIENYHRQISEAFRNFQIGKSS